MFRLFKRIFKYVVIRFRYFNKLLIYPSVDVGIHSCFEGANALYWNTKFNGTMGYGSYLASHCDVEANIGRFTSIAPYVTTNRGTHPFSYPFATTSPMFYSSKNYRTFAEDMIFNDLCNIVKIGNDCWIGQGAFLVGGISIGDGAVVLAGSVVTKDVPPYAIIGGVPAKVIKYRYDEDTISFLLNLKWWNKDRKWLRENYKLLCDIEELKKYVNNCRN